MSLTDRRLRTAPGPRRSVEHRRRTFDVVEVAEDGTPRTGFDAVSALTVYLALLLLIPSDRVLPGLGNLGAPAVMWGFACFLWWIWHVLSRPREERLLLSPVSVAAWIFIGTMLLSYVFAMMRPIPVAEVLPADRALLRMLSFLGVVLVASTGIRSFARLQTLLRRLVLLTAVVATIGIVEFFLRRPLAPMIPTPGLVSGGGGGEDMRGDFLRSTATAIHPLEYATALSIAFPVALMLALRTSNRTRVIMISCAGLIGVSLVLAGSRSAIVGLLVGAIPLLLVLGARERVAAAIGGIAAIALVYVAVPGMIGTLRNLFLTAGSDTSVLSRTASLQLVDVLLPLSPWVGRGHGTFLPAYQIFDNQIILLLIEVGIVGTLAFVAVHVAAIVCVARCRTAPPAISGIAAALAAGCLVAVSLSIFFDSFSFPKAFGLLALAPGLCAGAWRVSQNLPLQFATSADAHA